MYGPTPARPRKTNIVRSRKGCDYCRRRRQKCDEKRPRCGACERLGKRCELAQANALKFRQVSFSRQNGREDDPAPVDTGLTLCDSGSQVACDQAPEHLVIGIESTSQSSGSTLPVVPAIGVSSTPHPCDFSSSPVLTWADVQQLDCEPYDMATLPPHAPRCEEKAMVCLSERDQGGTASVSEFNARDEPYQRQAHDSIAMGLTGALQFRGHLNREMLYMNVWDTQCLTALHPAFRRFSIVDRISQVMLDTTMALSASYLSRRLPQRKPWDPSDIPGLSYRPGISHRNNGQHYYQSALRRVANWNGDYRSLDVSSTLAVLILFCSIESCMGNFSAFELHSRGVAALVQSSTGGPSSIAGPDVDLLSAWLQVRLLNWWRRFHFSPPLFQSSRLPITVQPELEAALNSYENRRVSVLFNLCESLSLSSMLTIRAWKAAQASGPRCHSEVMDFELEGCKTQLVAAARKLDEWHSRLPTSDLPIESFPVPRCELGKEYIFCPPRPLLFSSHEAAMNYAYYALARAIQTDAFLADDDGDTESDFWISLVMRVAAGIDWGKCIHHNVFTIGITSLLFACALRTKEVSVGLWIEDWLEERQRSGLEEGSFPVMQLLRILRIMNLERKNGYDILAIFQTEDDGGGSGKFDSYHSQVISSLMLYERCRTTGRLFSKTISV